MHCERLAAPETPVSEHVGESPAASPLAALCDDCLLAVLAAAGPQSRPALRLVCRRFQELVDGAMCPRLRVDSASHLAGGRPMGTPIYGSLMQFAAAATSVLERRAAGLQHLELNFDAYGCVFAAALLRVAPLPMLRRVALLNVEAQHLAALRALPALRHVSLGREINGPVTAGPAAELLVAQLAGLALRSLHLRDYRMLPSLLASVADALPALEELSLGVERVGQHGRLDLSALPRLVALRRLELRLLGASASAEGTTVGALPAGAAALCALTSLALAHVRPAAGEEEPFWDGLAVLPALAELRYEASVHAVRQPPAALLRLSTLTALHIQVHGEVHPGDPPNSTWTQLPELPEGALPALVSLHVSSVGLVALPASWCRLPLQELSLSGRAKWGAWYSLRLPDELRMLVPTLRALRLDSCALVRGLPEQVISLTGLTSLRLRYNQLAVLPSLSPLRHLQELDIVGNLLFQAAEALQGCTALRHVLVGDIGSDLEAYLASMQRELAWVQYVGHPAS